MDHTLKGLIIMPLFVLWTVSGDRCPRRTAPSNYCRKECSSDIDCNRNKKCLCDGNCGLSCIRPDMQCRDNAYEAPQFGTREYKGRKFGNKIKYSCRQGYTLIGTPELICGGIGRWKPIEKTKPECMKMCPKPPTIQNGRVVGKSYEPGKYVNVRCYPGYEATSSQVIACGDDLRWMAPFPKCKVLECSQPDPPENAIIYKGEKSLYLYGDIVTFQCRPGYFSVGNTKATCEGKKWSNVEFVCKAKSCGRPDRILNGMIQGRLFTFRKTVRYRCKKGYSLVGDSYRFCQANQRWSGSAPYCKIKSCGPPPQLLHGRFKGFGRDYGSVLTLECDVGYRPKSLNQIQCEDSGKWNPDDVICKEIPKQCQDPPRIQNGAFLNYFVDSGKGNDFTCMDGVTKAHGDPLKCEDGEFKGVVPTCLKDIRYVGCYKDGHQRSMTFSSYLDGSQSAEDCFKRCLSKNQPYTAFQNKAECWCGETYDKHGKANDKTECSSQCIFNKRLKCGGEWRLSVYKTGCLRPEDPTNGVAMGKVYADGENAQYRCNSGFTLTGRSPKCKEHQWTGSAPRCEKTTCDKPKGELFKGLEKLLYPIDDQVKLSCIKGYSLKGNPFVKCGAGGVWSTLPECIRDPKGVKGFIGCFPILGQKMRFVGTMTKDERLEDCINLCRHNKKRFSSVHHGSYCMCGNDMDALLESKEGAEEGALPQYDDNCSTYRIAPVYAIGECYDPPQIENGRWTTSSQQLGGILTYNCNAGFRIEGQTQRKCMKALKWSGISPVCKAISCQTPPPKQNMNVHFTSSHHGAEAKVTCDKTYVRQGPNTIKCWSGQWSKITMMCLAPCSPRRGVQHGHWLYSAKDYIHGSTATLQCEDGYTVETENAIYSCENGNWKANGNHGTCERVKLQCPPLRTPAKGRFIIREVQAMKKAMFECELGYRLQGSRELVCRQGVWNGAEPRCTEGIKLVNDTCPVNMHENAATEVRDKSPSTEVKTFGCPRGQKLRGSAILVCRSGSSSATPPYCENAECSACTPNDKSFQTLCREHDTVFVGWVMRKPDARGIVTMKTKFSALKSSGKDRRLQINGNWQLKARQIGQCFCPSMEETKKYLIFMNLGGKDSDKIQLALPFEMPRQHISTLTRYCGGRSG